MSTFPATEHLYLGREPLYVHKPCGETSTWGNAMIKEYGDINTQGCDRCDSAPDGQWAEVRVLL